MRAINYALFKFGSTRVFSAPVVSFVNEEHLQEITLFVDTWICMELNNALQSQIRAKHTW